MVFIGLNVRIAQINAESGDEYTKSVLSQQEYTSTVLPYRRGDIVDRKGTVLATSERVYNVILYTKQLLATKDDEHINKVITSLVSSFQLDETQIRQYISKNPDNAYYIPVSYTHLDVYKRQIPFSYVLEPVKGATGISSGKAYLYETDPATNEEKKVWQWPITFQPN